MGATGRIFARHDGPSEAVAEADLDDYDDDGVHL
jgi:hypothetical protein